MFVFKNVGQNEQTFRLTAGFVRFFCAEYKIVILGKKFLDKGFQGIDYAGVVFAGFV